MDIANYSLLRQHYTEASRRLLLFDFDGTLTPISHVKVDYNHAPFYELFEILISDLSNDVVVISGRSKEDLDGIFFDMRLTLVAEHGGFIKEKGSEWRSLTDNVTSWKTAVLGKLTSLTEQYPGSSLEIKTFSIVWNYHGVSGDVALEEIIESLVDKTSDEWLIYREHSSIELRSSRVHKGLFVMHKPEWQASYDFVLGVGDGKSDEDLFKSIGRFGFSVKVGFDPFSYASAYVEQQHDVLLLLSAIVNK